MSQIKTKQTRKRAKVKAQEIHIHTETRDRHVCTLKNPIKTQDQKLEYIHKRTVELEKKIPDMTGIKEPPKVAVELTFS